MTSLNTNQDLMPRFSAVPSPSYGALTHKISTYFTNANDTATITIPTSAAADQVPKVCSRIASVATAVFTMVDQSANPITPSQKMAALPAGATSVVLTAGAADMWVDAYFAM